MKIDLHTHSTASKDGGISLGEYKRVLDEKVLDVVAVTDHDRIDEALMIQEALGSGRVIVGEEVRSLDGDIIGLYLTKLVPRMMSADETVKAIKDQGGIVYVPHPLDRRRAGLSREIVMSILPNIDVIEGFNARFVGPPGNKGAKALGEELLLPLAAGSDSHSVRELGSTYMEVEKTPKKKNLVDLVAEAELVSNMVSPSNFLAPSWNRIKKRLFNSHEDSAHG